MADTKYAANVMGMNFDNKNDSMAAGLAAAGAMAETNPNAKIVVAVGPQAAIGGMMAKKLTEAAKNSND